MQVEWGNRPLARICLKVPMILIVEELFLFWLFVQGRRDRKRGERGGMIGLKLCFWLYRSKIMLERMLGTTEWGINADRNDDCMGSMLFRIILWAIECLLWLKWVWFDGWRWWDIIGRWCYTCLFVVMIIWGWDEMRWEYWISVYNGKGVPNEMFYHLLLNAIRLLVHKE